MRKEIYVFISFIFSMFLVGCSNQGITQEEKDAVISHYHKKNNNYICDNGYIKCKNFTVDFEPIEPKKTDEINGITERGHVVVRYFMKGNKQTDWDSGFHNYLVHKRNGVFKIDGYY